MVKFLTKKNFIIVKCPYKNCILGCKNARNHHAHYAYMSQENILKNTNVNKRSDRIDYDVLYRMGLFKGDMSII